MRAKSRLKLAGDFDQTGYGVTLWRVRGSWRDDDDRPVRPPPDRLLKRECRA
jgi:hypothetical protein